jgi:putative FmdB family regulatory protein
MPLYEYQCTKCKHRFERIRKFSDRPITKCPECGSKVEQLISAAAVQFKGSGWYVTDYAKKSSSASSDSASADGSSAKLVDKDSARMDSMEGSSKSDSSPDSNAESKSESKSQPKSDSKSEPKSESKSSSKKSDKKKS